MQASLKLIILSEAGVLWNDILIQNAHCHVHGHPAILITLALKDYIQ